MDATEKGEDDIIENLNDIIEHINITSGVKSAANANIRTIETITIIRCK